MRIKIENIKIPWYAPREAIDEEFLDELAKSMSGSGQFDPLIVRRNEVGEFELISGSQRLAAAQKLGWTEIEATERDVSEDEAALMSVEVNLKRRPLQEIEEGRAIKKIMDKYGLTQEKIAGRLGKSQSWVGDRLQLALDVIKEVQNAFTGDRITLTQAVIIGQLPKNRQARFLEIIIEKQRGLNRKLSREETRLELKRFLNDTIYTIGYGGRDLKDFIKILRDNGIEILVDVRESGTSMHRPEFSKKVLKERIIEAKIKYTDKPEFGVPYDIREAYINGKPYELNGAKIKAGFSHECFKQWYLWHIRENAEKLVRELKDSGRAAIMCAEKYPQPKGEQKHYCHRDILANLMLDSGILEKRIDL